MFKPALDVRLEAENTTLITLPLFHSTGQTAQMNASIYGGMRNVLVPRFDPAVVTAVGFSSGTDGSYRLWLTARLRAGASAARRAG